MPEKLYNFSFDKKSLTLLAVCSLVLAGLLVSAGYLLGSSHVPAPAENVADTTSESGAAPPTAAPTPIPAPVTPPAPAPESTSAPPGPAAAAPEPAASAAPAAPEGPAASASDAPDPAGPADASKPAVEKASGRYTLQFDSFQDRAAALAKIKQLKAESVAATLFTAQDQAGQTWFAVRTGAYPDLVSASKAADALASQTGEFVIVRPSRRL